MVLLSAFDHLCSCWAGSCSIGELGKAKPPREDSGARFYTDKTDPTVELKFLWELTELPHTAFHVPPILMLPHHEPTDVAVQ